MKYIFVNRFFHPDQSATAIMLGDLLEGLDVDPTRCLVIASSGAHTPGDDIRREKLEDIEVVRVPALEQRSRSLMARALDFVIFYFGIVLAGLWHFKRGDVIVCLTDPPLISIPVRAVAQVKGAKVINWLQDIYPETATELGYGSQGNPFIRIMTRLRNSSWKKARANVCIGQRMARKVQAIGVAPDKIQVIPNWADERSLTPLAAGDNELRSEWNFSETSVVIGYSGNLGRAHDLGTMLDASRRLINSGETHLQFLFVGGGAKHGLLPNAADEPELATHFKVRKYRPRDELRSSLSVVDVHWLSLEPELEGLIVPSKFYGAISVGRPIVFIGDTDGEIAEIIREAKCGASFKKGDVEGLADYLRALGRNEAMRVELGSNGRSLL